MSTGNYAVCPRCKAVIEPDTLHTCPPVAPVVDWQWLRCLKAGKFYPDYAGTGGLVGLRYCGAGDLIFVKPDDVHWLLDGLLCERHVMGAQSMQQEKKFPVLDMTLGNIKTELCNLKELVSALCDDAFGAGVQGSINWGDLDCIEASFCINADGELAYKVLVEEAAPEATELRDFIVDGLEKYGFAIARLTVETAW